jgi:hypothetical protein
LSRSRRRRGRASKSQGCPNAPRLPFGDHDIRPSKKMKKEKEIHDKLAAQNIRIFALRAYPNNPGDCITPSHSCGYSLAAAHGGGLKDECHADLG